MSSVGSINWVLLFWDRRPHQALGYRTPAEVFYGETVEEDEELKERRRSDQRVSVSHGEVQESHLIVA